MKQNVWYTLRCCCRVDECLCGSWWNMFETWSWLFVLNQGTPETKFGSAHLLNFRVIIKRCNGSNRQFFKAAQIKSTTNAYCLFLFWQTLFQRQTMWCNETNFLCILRWYVPILKCVLFVWRTDQVATLRNSTYCIGSLSHAWTPTMIFSYNRNRDGGKEEERGGDSKVVLFIGQSCFAIAFEYSIYNYQIG